MKPFNLKEVLAGEPFGNKLNGKAKEFHVVPEAFDNLDPYPIKVVFETGEKDTFTRDGKSNKWSSDENQDLYMLPEAKEYFTNVYPKGPASAHSSRKLADNAASSNRIGLLKVTITGNDIKAEVL